MNNGSLTVTMETIPVVSLIWQHVLCWEAVCILLNSGFVPLGPNFLMELDQVVLHSQVEQTLGCLLVQLVVPVHVTRQSWQRRYLLLGPDCLNENKALISKSILGSAVNANLDAVPYYLSFVRVTDPPRLLEEANTGHIHCYELHLQFKHTMTSILLLINAYLEAFKCPGGNMNI